MEEEDDKFFYHVYRVLLHEKFIFPEHTKILSHWEACNLKSCPDVGCRRLTKLQLHYDNCQQEFCRVCIPVRWLICCHKVTSTNQTLLPGKFHVGHYAEEDASTEKCQE